MGKKSWKRKKEQEGPGREGNLKETQEKGVRKNYQIIVKENQNFENYYKLQCICPESEWESFMGHLRISLPATFRITGSRGQAKALLYVIEKKLIEDLIKVEDVDEKDKVKPFALPWYPENFAWQVNLSRQDIRRNEANFRLHNFLIAETESGNISRQEAVSMIPPLVLNVEPHHKVVDLCAAPGSKTAQLIEMLHAKQSGQPEGFLIANDMDNKRCYMLVHQAKRLQSPAFIITNHDASHYPDLFLTEGDTKKFLKFDRVLCDVPCSGDGTVRKNVDVWRKWTPSNALFLHQTQYLILVRGLQLLEVGGELVYSTCSLNPIENEAVVHRVLKEMGGAVELLDINLPNLKYSIGLSTWKPCGPDIVPYTSMADVPTIWKSCIREHHFPPSVENSSKFHLEKCVRILPHQQDTGGFFVARFGKLRNLPNEKVQEAETEVQELASGKSKPPPAKKLRRLYGYKEDPYVFMSETDPIWKPLREFYNLDESLDSTHFLTRSLEGKKKNIYYTTPLVKNIVSSNEGNIKIINTGIKTFARADNKWTSCDFRLAQEGLQSLLPFINGRTATVTRDDLIILLLNDEEHKPPPVTTLSESTQKQLEKMERGSIVVIMDCQDTSNGPAVRVELIGWRGLTSLRAYVSLNDRLHYLLLCGGDVSKFQKNKFEKQPEVAEANSYTESVAETSKASEDSTSAKDIEANIIPGDKEIINQHSA